MNRMGLLLLVTVAAGCDSTRTPTAPSSPTPTPTPLGPDYSISGIVVDADTGRPIANANVAVGFSQGQLTSLTAADGTYAFSFSTTQPYRNNLPDVLGLLIVWLPTVWEPGIGYEHMVQEIPRAASQIVQNVRLRPRRRVIMAGDSMQLSIEPDSSRAFDWEYAPWELASYGIVRLGRVWEWFYVSPARDGLLTIEARPESGGGVPFLGCFYVGCPGLNAQGPVSIDVRASGVYFFRVEIPKESAPQRYVITTSLK